MVMVGVQILGLRVSGEKPHCIYKRKYDPGSWSLDNFGQQLIATIKNGKTFTWTLVETH